MPMQNKRANSDENKSNFKVEKWKFKEFEFLASLWHIWIAVAIISET